MAWSSPTVRSTQRPRPTARVQRVLRRRSDLPRCADASGGQVVAGLGGHRARRRGRVGPHGERPRPGVRRVHDLGRLQRERGQGPGPRAPLRLAAGRVRAGGAPAGVGHPRRGFAAGRPHRRSDRHRRPGALHDPLLPGLRCRGGRQPPGLGGAHVRPDLPPVRAAGPGPHARGHHRHHRLGGHDGGHLCRGVRTGEGPHTRGQVGPSRHRGRLPLRHPHRAHRQRRGLHRCVPAVVAHHRSGAGLRLLPRDLGDPRPVRGDPVHPAARAPPARCSRFADRFFRALSRPRMPRRRPKATRDSNSSRSAAGTPITGKQRGGSGASTTARPTPTSSAAGSCGSPSPACCC